MKKTEKKKKTEEAPIDWIDARTGFSMGTWLHICQAEIVRASGPVIKRGKYKGHSRTDVLAWIFRVVKFAFRSAQVAKRHDRDENMTMASLLGMIFAVWYVRVHRAKAMDPRRPLRNRKAAMEQAVQYVGALNRALHDDAYDPMIWKDQEWENPWAEGARDGSFV